MNKEHPFYKNVKLYANPLWHHYSKYTMGYLFKLELRMLRKDNE